MAFARSLSLIVILILAWAVPTIIKAEPLESETDVAKREIWAKELAIYAGRSQGKLDFYVNNASPEYLGWPAGAPAPFPLDRLRSGGQAMQGHAQEKIDTQLKGFTLSGSTAVIYYVNHRTMMADGTPVDQYYDNIHVWVYEGNDWKVIGSMSRPMPAAH